MAHTPALPFSLIKASPRDFFLSPVTYFCHFLFIHRTGAPKLRRTKSCFSTIRKSICKVRSAAFVSPNLCFFCFPFSTEIPTFLSLIFSSPSLFRSLSLHRRPQARLLYPGCDIHRRPVMGCPGEWLAFVPRAKAGTADDDKAFCEEIVESKKGW